MKKILAILFILTTAQITFAQTQAYQLDEIMIAGGNCDMFSRLNNLVDVLNKENGKGLIIVHADSKGERFGNVLAYVSGAKRWLKEWIRVPTDQISFVISSGKPQFTQETWVVPKNAKMPEIPAFSFDWESLSNKYHFSQACLQCEPSYPLLTSFQPNFEKFANVLKNYPNYKGQIHVNNYWELAQIKRNLTLEQKLRRNRYSIKWKKQRKDEEWSISIVDLYLVPNSKAKTLASIQ